MNRLILGGVCLSLGCETKLPMAVGEGPAPAASTWAPTIDTAEDGRPVDGDDTGGEPGDSDDTASPCTPTEELCDGIDNDCDGEIDEGLETNWFRDADGDGFGDPAEDQRSCEQPEGYIAENTDCDDSDIAVHPDAVESCNTIDDDCDGRIDEGVGAVFYTDLDGDGFGDPDTAMLTCDTPFAMITMAGDCDDLNDGVHPDAIEECNGLDDDCDGRVDEGAPEGATAFFVDADGDGHGDVGRPTRSACTLPEGYAEAGDDCDDTDSGISPSAVELCNEVDDDCDGAIDEDLYLAWYTDGDGDGHGTGSPVYDCVMPPGTSASDSDCDDERSDIHPGATEVCDDVDNDCDGTTDEGLRSTYWADSDGDGYGSTSSVEACAAPAGHVAVDGDCHDGRSDIHPGATEVCDWADNDCDGEVDEGVLSTFWADADGDGYGSSSSTAESCAAPEGYVSVDGDCHDGRSDDHPGATEVCDYFDNDCDGVVDEGSLSLLYWDGDGDGHGDPEVTEDRCGESGGWVFDSTDCDDSVFTTSPSAGEYCDGVDNDCDGVIDEYDALDASTWYDDYDSDGYGDPVLFWSVEACEMPEGYTHEDDATDCVDTDASIHPGAAEVCDEVDNDCDGTTDAGAIDATTWYPDDDEDHFGLTSAAWDDCWGADDYITTAGDCDDDDRLIHPDAFDVCDGKDNNCNGSIDEMAGECPCPQVHYGGASYLLCSETEIWNDAKRECRAWGYDLVSIHSYAEEGYLDGQIALTGRPWDFWWIGFHDRGGGWEGTFRWSDGSTVVYDAWADGQPDDWRRDEDCATMNFGTILGADWNDIHCDNRYPYICKAD